MHSIAAVVEETMQQVQRQLPRRCGASEAAAAWQQLAGQGGDPFTAPRAAAAPEAAAAAAAPAGRQEGGRLRARREVMLDEAALAARRASSAEAESRRLLLEKVMCVLACEDASAGKDLDCLAFAEP